MVSVIDCIIILFVLSYQGLQEILRKMFDSIIRRAIEYVDLIVLLQCTSCTPIDDSSDQKGPNYYGNTKNHEY